MTHPHLTRTLPDHLKVLHCPLIGFPLFCHLCWRWQPVNLSLPPLLRYPLQKRILNLKNISTCFLAVVCFFVCSCPLIVYSILRLASGMPPYDRQVLLFNLWSNTFLSINSTFNCVIFFWRNSILRHEGIKIVKSFRRNVVT